MGLEEGLLSNVWLSYLGKFSPDLEKVEREIIPAFRDYIVLLEQGFLDARMFWPY